MVNEGNFHKENDLCWMCRKKMRRWAGQSWYWKTADHVKHMGYGGNDYFCTMRCAAEFGVRKASAMVDE